MGTPFSDLRPGDRVRVDAVRYPTEDRFIGRVGTIRDRVSPRDDAVLVVNRTGGSSSPDYVFTYATEVTKVDDDGKPVGPSPTEIVVDVKRLQALQAAKELVGTNNVDKFTAVASFILGESAPATVVPSVTQDSDLDACRRMLEMGYFDGLEVTRDRADDGDLIYITGGNQTIDQTEKLIEFLQAALRVGKADGTRPPFKTGDTPF